MKRLTLIILILILTSTAYADQPPMTWVNVGLYTYHGHGPDANHQHYPRGIHIDAPSPWELHRGYGLILFENSFYESAAALYTTGYTQPDSWRFNYLAGLTSGYCDEILPMILPMISWKWRHWAGEAGCIPNSDQHVTCAAMFRVAIY